MAPFLKSNSVEALKRKSASIVDVFTRTVEDLNDVNQEIQKVAEDKAAEKARLEADLAILNLQKDENSRVIRKIEQIFKP